MSLSASDPLRFVVVPGTTGTVGMCACPRELKADLESIAAWGAAALVTSLAPEELQDLRMPPPAWGEICARLGMEWHHLPLPEAAAPGREFEESWAYAGLRLRQHLRAGRRIAVHGGDSPGRAACLGARLLVEFGMPADEAFAAVGGLENHEQETWVRRCRALAEDLDLRRSRIAGCLLGGAVGDAFGFPVQFKPLPSIRARYGPNGIQAPQFSHGKLTVSDKTQMSLFTLEGLLRGLASGEALEEIRRAYLDWLDTQGYGRTNRRCQGELAAEPALRVVRAPGTTCVNALREGGRGTIAKPVNRSKGCGGMIRAAPIGLFPDHLDAEAAFQLGAETAALTHGHSTGFLCAGVVAAIVRRLMDGVDLRRAAGEGLAVLRRRKGHEEAAAAMEAALGNPRKVQDLGAGWVAEEALAIGLHAALQSPTFEAALAMAANHDGDSNSAACLAGQLWGAWKGVSSVPHAWASALDILPPLLALLWRTSASRSSTASRSW